jgi:acyl dehydratase
VIAFPDVLAVRSSERVYRWSDRDVMLYALAIGFGDDPTLEASLRFTYERGLQVLPTFATVAAWGADPPLNQTGIHVESALHGQQSIIIHRPLTSAAAVAASGRIVGVIDKGPSRAALLLTETVLKDADDGEPVATLRALIVARGEGGFGGPSEDAPALNRCPQRAPDRTVEIRTRPDQALLYRLTGDRNPLHADPTAARAAGFERPILHGLCTFGITCRAVMQSYPDIHPDAVSGHEARFAAPIFPGETFAIDLWRDGSVIAFQARAKERHVLVVTHGKMELRDGARGSAGR